MITWLEDLMFVDQRRPLILTLNDIGVVYTLVDSVETQIHTIELKNQWSGMQLAFKRKLQRFEHDRCSHKGEKCAGAQDSKC